jgi:uncharacterized protein YbjQ (UPF0145 family)
MILSNLEQLPGKTIVRHLGLVHGSTIRAKHAGHDFLASIKNIFGGELQGYTNLLSEARTESIQRLEDEASAIGANAVLNIRFSTASIAAGAAEILVYGTAVFVEDTIDG